MFISINVLALIVHPLNENAAIYDVLNWVFFAQQIRIYDIGINIYFFILFYTINILGAISGINLFKRKYIKIWFYIFIVLQIITILLFNYIILLCSAAGC